MTLRVALSSSAELDLIRIADWIAERAGSATARDYVDRVKSRVLRLGEFSTRGVPKPEFGDRVLSLSFERRLLILYRVEDDVVRVLRVVSARRDLRGLSL